MPFVIFAEERFFIFFPQPSKFFALIALQKKSERQMKCTPKVSDLLFFYNLIYYLFLPAKRETRPNTADVPTQMKEAMKRSLNTPLQPKLSAIVPKP